MTGNEKVTVMRKLLISILLAGAAASPALAAQDRDNEQHPSWGEARESRQDRQQAREQRQQAREQLRPQQPETRPEPPRFEAPQPQVQSTDRSERVQRGDGVSRWTRDNVQQPGETSRWTREPDQRAGETSRWTRDRSGGWTRPGGDLRESDRPVPNVMRTRNPLVVSGTPREGTQPPLREEARRPAVQWNTNWRHNDRYDWRHWRDRHRSWFRVGVYYDPFGWSYRPYQIGWRLWPSYYSRSYWIEDPWRYRLPYAPPGYVWVRYWDDALLVDTWSGEVVDVIQNFFW
jgi:Ni/Co efflux regulator RcnB